MVGVDVEVDVVVWVDVVVDVVVWVDGVLVTDSLILLRSLIVSLQNDHALNLKDPGTQDECV